MEEQPEVTVAVAVKDRRDLMAACLDGILGQDGHFEVVVVDNGSTDGTLELLRSCPDERVRVLEHPGSLGAVRNAAVAAARAPFVAFTDSDCVPEPGWLKAGLDAFTDDVGVVQGQTLPEADVERGRWSATQELTELTGRYEACNLFYRTDALRAAGGFDEAVGFFGEDTAAGWAVLRDGWRPAYTDAAVVRHVVTHPGLGWHLRRALGYSNVNALVRRFPELRGELLWHRFFLRPRSAAFAALVVSTLGLRWRPLALLALPYLWLRRPKGRHRQDLLDAAGAAAFDAAVFAGLARGSVRHRRIVL